MDVPEPSIVIGVQDLFARYAHRIDRRDFDGFGELFTADAEYAFGDNERHGREAIKEFLQGVMTSPGGAHIITNVSVRASTADGGGGRYDALADYLLTRRPEPDAPFAVLGTGFYETTVVLDNGAWRFAVHRTTPR